MPFDMIPSLETWKILAEKYKFKILISFGEKSSSISFSGKASCQTESKDLDRSKRDHSRQVLPMKIIGDGVRNLNQLFHRWMILGEFELDIIEDTMFPDVLKHKE